MAKTYAQLTQEIETLKTRADAILQKEKAGVVSRIRKAIVVYGLTAQELGFDEKASPAKARASASVAKAAAPTSGAAKSTAPKYRDEAGNIWGGRGPRPAWLRAGLASGRSLESFAASQGKEPTAPATKKAAKKFKSVVKYRDESGNQWSGRGPKPRWLTAAIEGGKTLAQLAA